MYMLQILNLNYLPFDFGEIIHISRITSGHLGDLGFNYEFGFFKNGLGFDFGETF